MEKTPENAESAVPREVLSGSNQYTHLHTVLIDQKLLLKIWNDDLQKMFQRTCCIDWI